jgi:hypothetical protein
MNAEAIIFVGFELTDEVSDCLSDCAEQDRIYLNDPNYLETVTIDGHDYIGKRSKGNLAVDRLEDISRSVVSLLFRVSNRWTKKAHQATIIAAQEDDKETGVLIGDEKDGKDNFDYSELVD